MILLVKLFGIAMVGMGVAFLVSKDLMKKYMNYWVKPKRIYTGGVISILVGIIFLLAASEAEVAWFVIFLGIWALLKGIILFALGPDKAIAKIKWWTARPPKVMRFCAILAIVIGALLIYSA